MKLSKIISGLLLILLFISCSGKSKENNDLSYLRKYDGKYPRDVNFLDDPIIKPRLEKMMGKRYDFVKLIWDIENPIKITNDFLSAWGMQLGSGGDPAAIILIDLKKNIIYAAVREEGNLEVYSENGSKAPTFLEENKW